MDRIEVIKELYEKEGWSISRLGRQFGHSRKTIRKYLQGASPTYTRQADYKSPISDPILSLIEEWFKADLHAPRKQRRTGQKMYADLCSQYGYQGSYSTVRRILNIVRGIHKEVFIPREHYPGEYVEFDLGYAKVDLQGERVEVVLHCFQLTYSNDIFVYVSKRAIQEEIFESHKRAFVHFEGIPKKIRYDNLAQIVKKVLKGKGREKQDSFICFREQFGFESEFCEIAKGWQKGDVEGCVGYARRNYFAPVPQINDLEDFNEALSQWCASLRTTRQVHGKQQKVGELYEEEKQCLFPLKLPLPQVGKLLSNKANHYSLVSVDASFYSVPSKYAYQVVDVLLTYDQVIISFKGLEIAHHKRSFEKGKSVFDPLHYLPVFVKKPYALINSKPIHQLPPIFHQFFEKAYVKGYGRVEDCIQILELLRCYSVDDVQMALELADGYKTYYVEGVKNILTQLHSENPRSEPLILKDSPQLLVDIPLVNLDRYNQLIPGGSL